MMRPLSITWLPQALVCCGGSAEHDDSDGGEIFASIGEVREGLTRVPSNHDHTITRIIIR